MNAPPNKEDYTSTTTSEGDTTENEKVVVLFTDGRLAYQRR